LTGRAKVLILFISHILKGYLEVGKPRKILLFNLSKMTDISRDFVNLF